MQDDHSRTDVEAALARILADDKFACAPQMSAFLAYVVRQTLDGRAERIKAYTIGIEALGKPETFDSQTDPSVRVLAKRLRTCLVAYHERHPDAAPAIEIRPGCYRPLFLARGAAHPAPGSMPTAVTGYVEDKAFRQSPGGIPDAQANAARGANDESSSAPDGRSPQRARPTLPTVRVSDAYRAGSSGAALAAVASGVLARADGLQAIRLSRDETVTWPEDYALSLEAIESDEAVRVELQLVRALDGLVLHALTCEVALRREESGRLGEELPAAAIETVERFASALAGEDGPLLRDYRVQTLPDGSSDVAPNAPRAGTAVTLERPLALEEALRYPPRNGSRLADAA